MQPVKEFISLQTIRLLEKQDYDLFGLSAVKIRHYTKTALTDKGTCYKQKFYGIQSHQCIQMSPASSFCDQKCSYCWRPTHTFKPAFRKEDGSAAGASQVDAPVEIVSASIAAQTKQLSGFGGHPRVNPVKFAQ